MSSLIPLLVSYHIATDLTLKIALTLEYQFTLPMYLNHIG